MVFWLRYLRNVVGRSTLRRLGRSLKVRNIYKHHLQKAALREGLCLEVETHTDTVARQEPEHTNGMGGRAGKTGTMEESCYDGGGGWRGIFGDLFYETPLQTVV